MSEEEITKEGEKIMRCFKPENVKPKLKQDSGIDNPRKRVSHI
jgi:hypothetical protein